MNATREEPLNPAGRVLEHTAEERDEAWNQKMTELEAIHHEIELNARAWRLAVDDDDADGLNSDFELTFLICGR